MTPIDPTTDDVAVATPATVDVHLDAAIERRGYAVVHATGDARRPSWSHSVGLGGLGHPELVVVGVTAAAGEAVISWIVDLVRAGEPLAPGREHPHSFLDVPIRLVPVPERCWDDDNDLLAACAARRDDIASGSSALQVVWADRAGRFPWEAAFDPDLVALQPLLEHRWTMWRRR